MKNLLFKFIILLNAIISIFASSCMVEPTIPTDTPLMLTTADIPNFPTSTKQLSFYVELTPHEVCPYSITEKFPLFYMTFGTEYFGLVVECMTSRINTHSSYWHLPAATSFVSSSDYGTIVFFFTFDFDAKDYRSEVQTSVRRSSGGQSIKIPAGLAFDANTKFYFCADYTGASSKSCTISQIKFEYKFYQYPSLSFLQGHISGGEAALAAFYPLRDGPATSLASSAGSLSNGYFGDDASNPTSGTSPTWDCSNAFVNIDPGQFLTFPLPTFASVGLTISKSFSFAAWVKFTELPSGYTTIFSMHSADGTQVGYKLRAVKATGSIGLEFNGQSIASAGDINTPRKLVYIKYNTWQLIGFSVGINSNEKTTDVTVFIGDQFAHYYENMFNPTYDLSAATIIRVGGATDSFKGQVSLVRLMTPGGGYIKSKASEICSPDNSIELGQGDFTLACSASTTLNPSDNTCYSTCPGSLNSAVTFTDFPIPLCLSSSSPSSACQVCPTHCKTCDSTKCLSCDTNYFLSKGACVNPCPAKTYSDSTSCIACSSHCSQCDASGCQVCDNGYEVDSAKKCILKSSPSTPGTPGKEESGSGGSGSGISVGIIVAIVLGSLLCFLLVIFLIWRIQKKLRSRRVAKFATRNLSLNKMLRSDPELEIELPQ